MDVSEALKLGDLRHAKILAGHRGLNRKVEAAEVMEVPDINDWLTEGILIISTFYSIKDRPDAQINMFKTLIDVNGAGLVIKVGRYVEELPQEMYDLANEYHMPIIALNVEVSFVNILTTLFEKIYEEKKAYQTNQFQLLNKLLNTEVNSLKGFLSGLSSLTGGNVYLESIDHRLLATAKKVPNQKRKSFNLLSLPVEYADYSNANNESLIDQDRIVMLLTEKEQVVARLHFILQGRPHSTIDMLKSCEISIKEQAKLLLLKEQFDVEKRYMRENKYIDDLLNDKNLTEGEQPEWKIDFDNYLYGFFSLDFSDVILNSPVDQNSRDYTLFLLYKQLYETLDEYLEGTIMYHKEYYFYGVYTCKDQHSRSKIIERLKKIVTKLETKFKTKIYCGVSLPHHHLQEISKAIDEAEVCLKTREDLDIKESIIHYEKMGVDKILLKLKNDKDVLHFIEMTLDTLTFDDKSEELIDTLDVFLKENGNQSKTSERLFIHRRTLKYRLNKIETLLNINLDDSDTRFLLYFLLKMKKIHIY
ncbi:PucR family transcriptional regulator [Evansella halocellulosilytica]|uniref:PucR family transcriptional regulator n=1 Tax=Evansella halocellulosilytica TaxID=2011013 RepID=UPI0015CEB4CE|nr:PucR family transcriptional regulator [Evansella halocellulosilytica]